MRLQTLYTPIASPIVDGLQPFVTFEGRYFRTHMDRHVRQRGNSLDQIARHAVLEILAPDEDMNMGSMRRKKHNGLSC